MENVRNFADDLSRWYVEEDEGHWHCSQISRKQFSNYIPIEHVVADPVILGFVANIAVAIFRLWEVDFKENVKIRFMCVHSHAEIFQSTKVKDDCYFIVVSREFILRYHYEYCLLASVGELRESLGFGPSGNLLSVSEYHKGVRLESEVLRNLTDENCLLVFFFYMCIFHELAHILNGHLDLVESIEKHAQEVDQLTYQVLEWDADFFAIQKSMRFLSRRTYTAEALKYSHSSFVEAVCVALYSFIFMGRRKGPDRYSLIELAQEPGGKYPSYISRFMLSLNTVLSESNLPKEWLRKECDLGVVTVGKLFFESFGVEVDSVPAGLCAKHCEALKAATDVYAAALEFKWRDIRQELYSKRRRKSAIAGIDHDFLGKKFSNTRCVSAGYDGNQIIAAIALCRKGPR